MKDDIIIDDSWKIKDFKKYRELVKNSVETVLNLSTSNTFLKVYDYIAKITKDKNALYLNFYLHNSLLIAGKADIKNFEKCICEEFNIDFKMNMYCTLFEFVCKIVELIEYKNIKDCYCVGGNYKTTKRLI